MREEVIGKSKEYQIFRYNTSASAITLISLVITIVVLIILASVAIYLSLGNNGIFVRGREAREVTNKQTATEKINLKITTAQMNRYAEEQRMPTLKELSLVLKDDDEIEYVTQKSKKLASAEYDVPSEDPSSIYTKLNKYPYEFEINGALQLASIDGIKIAASESKDTVGITGLSKIFTAYQSSTTKNTYTLKNFTINTDFTDFNKYLKFEDNLITIIEDGWYKIDTLFYGYSSPSSGSSSATLHLIKNEVNMEVGHSEAVNSYSRSFSDSNSETLYLKKGTIIDFKKVINTTFTDRCTCVINLYKL